MLRALGLRPKHGVIMSLNESPKLFVDHYEAELSYAQPEVAQNMTRLS